MFNSIYILLLVNLVQTLVVIRKIFLEWVSVIKPKHLPLHLLFTLHFII